VYSLKFLFLILYSLFLSLFIPISMPNVHIATFSPLLTFIYAKTSYPLSLWASLAVGLYFDLMASKSPLGFYSLSYCIATTLIYRYRRFFLLEKWWIFSLYTAIFSFAATIVQIILLALFNAKVPIHFWMILSDLGLMPILDAVFAFIFFLVPYAAWKYLTNPSQMHYWKEKWKQITSQN